MNNLPGYKLPNLLSDPPQSFGRRKLVRVNCCRQGVQAADERWRRGVQKLVGNAVHASIFRGWNIFPVADSDNLFERNPIARPAPGRDDHLGIERRGIIERNLGSRPGHELTPCRLHQFGDPELRSDEWLAPLFAEDAWPRQAPSSLSNTIDLAAHCLNHSQAFLARINDPGDHCNIGVYVS